MASSYTVRVTGLREFQRLMKNADKETRKQLRGIFRETGEAVRVAAQSKFERIDADSAAGYRVVVRQRGVSVEQSRRRTTGKHPQYGSLQMRVALEPSLAEKRTETIRLFERAIDKIIDAGGG